MRVVVTGAAGNIGRIVTDALAPHHRLVLIDRRKVLAPNWIVADVSRHRMSTPWSPAAWRRRWDRSFEGASVVVHLAADPEPRSPWRRILRHNIVGAWHVLEAAAARSVPRVVFASSGWAVRSLITETATASGAPGRRIGSDAFPRPRTPYGLSKAFGELAGRMLVDEGRLDAFLAVRIGYAAPRSRMAAIGDGQLRQCWLGPEDLASLVRRCVEADVSGYHVLYGVSSRDGSPFDLSYTERLLGWTPRETLDSPVDGS